MEGTEVEEGTEIEPKVIVIRDKYSHLQFRNLSSIDQVDIGMMIQVLMVDVGSPVWTWREIDTTMLKQILFLDKKDYKNFRIPDYA